MMNIFLLLFGVLWFTESRAESVHRILQTTYGNEKKQVDTLLPELAWPYYIFESTEIEGYKAMMFEPQMPCSIQQFMCGVGSMTDSASKECELFVWSDAGGEPGLLLFDENIAISAVDSGEVYFYWHKLSSPVSVVGPFWIGVKEQGCLFPTVVFDKLPSGKSIQSKDGTNWQVFDGDYFYGVVIDYGGEAEIYVEPDSLELFVKEGQVNSEAIWVYNGSPSCNLLVDSIRWSKNWISSVNPETFLLTPGNSKRVDVVVEGSGVGEYRDTLWIFSNDPDESIYPVPVLLSVVGVDEESEKLKVKSVKLKVYPNPALGVTNIRFQIPDTKYQNSDIRQGTSNISLKIYDVAGKLVKVLFEGEKECGVHTLSVRLSCGVYFVKLRVNGSPRPSPWSGQEIIKKLIIIR